jgi:hypothetical protein
MHQEMVRGEEDGGMVHLEVMTVMHMHTLGYRDTITLTSQRIIMLVEVHTLIMHPQIIPVA